MSVMEIMIEPRRVTVFFDCRKAPPASADQWRIERAIEDAMALPEAAGNAQETLPLAA